jgi:hypothetical protein
VSIVIEFVRGDLAAVARTTLHHPQHGLSITLYPVFHVGSPTFYELLSEDLARFRVFLLEGVRWRGLKGEAYDLAARNLGLVTQQSHLHLPPDAERLVLDMSEKDFAAGIDALPLLTRIVLRLLRPLMWLATATRAGRDAIWDSFSKESYVRGLKSISTPLDELIKTKRDRVMCDVLRRFVEDPIRIQAAKDVAVVAGTQHMPALYVTLRDCGYEKGNVRWFEVLEGLTIPARGTDGRAIKAARD